MKKTEVKLSVVIPVYNAENYIARCLGSVLSQDLKDIEIICVDDGSTDASLCVLEEYAARCSQLKIIRQEHKHAGVARNAGMDVAVGEYIHFLDADDYLYPDVYSNMYNLACEKKADYLKIKAKSFDADSGELLEQQLLSYNAGFMKNEDFGKVVNLATFSFGLIDNQFVTPWSGIYRRKFLEENFIRFNNLKCVNDRSFYIQVILQAKRVVYMDLFAVAHQIGNNSSLKGIRGDNFDCHFKSYYEIIALTTNCDTELRKRILLWEIKDVLIWYRQMSEAQKEKMKYDLYRFFSGIDWSIIERNEELYIAMREINEFLSCYGRKEIVQLEKLKQELVCTDDLYLYGAGVMGKRLLNYLKERGIIPKCIIVSDSEEESVFYDVHIRKIKNAFSPDIESNVVIILAAKSNYHIQMLSNLRSYSYKKAITLSDYDFDKLLDMA